MMPVNPPTVKRKMNPLAHKTGMLSWIDVEPYKVDNQEKILTPVGTAIVIVAEVK